MDIHEEILIEQLHKKSGINYEDIPKIDNYPLDISLKALKVLVEHACLCQNYVSIELGRKKISEIDKSWLGKYLITVAKNCLNLDDEWEYRRLLELVIEAIPELKNDVINIGMNSSNDDVKDAITDYI